MKKILITTFILLSVNIITQAQQTTETFAKKDNVIGLGFGVGGVYGFSSFDSQSPVFGAHYDRGIIELGMGGVIGVGGFIGYKSFANNYNSGPDKFKQRWNIFIVGARGTFHYDLFKVKNLDTYGGAMLAFHSVGYSDNASIGYYNDNDFDGNHGSAAYASVFAGAKYYFAPQVAAFAEVGYGVSWLTMGIAFKF